MFPSPTIKPKGPEATDASASPTPDFFMVPTVYLSPFLLPSPSLAALGSDFSLSASSQTSPSFSTRDIEEKMSKETHKRKDKHKENKSKKSDKKKEKEKPNKKPKTSTVQTPAPLTADQLRIAALEKDQAILKQQVTLLIQGHLGFHKHIFGTLPSVNSKAAPPEPHKPPSL